MEGEEEKVIMLRPVTKENYEVCCKLHVAKEQEAYVAPNVFSLTQSKYLPERIPVAIYWDETMIGFGLYGIDTGRNENWLFRFMLGNQYQGRGWGKQAFAAFLDMVSARAGYDAVYLSVNLENKTAQHMYRSFGFEDTGKMACPEEKIMKKMVDAKK